MADKVSIDWEIVGVDEFADDLEDLSWRGLNPEPAMRKVGELWQGWIEEQFDTQGVRFLGHKWAKLSNETIRRKKSTTILIETATLLLEATDPDNIHTEDDGVTFEMSSGPARYGGFHQTGTERMPQREIIHFGPIDRERSVSIVEQYILDGRI